MRVRGWSVSWKDAVAVAAFPVGVAGIILSPAAGGAVMAPTGSLVLGTGVAVIVALAGALLALGAVVHVFTVQRTYRHPVLPVAKVGSLL